MGGNGIYISEIGDERANTWKYVYQVVMTLVSTWSVISLTHCICVDIDHTAVYTQYSGSALRIDTKSHVHNWDDNQVSVFVDTYFLSARQ